MFFLEFITSSIKRAVLKGFQQAVEELQLSSEGESAADPLAVLQERVTPRPAIAAPVEPEAKSRKSGK